MKTIFFDDHTIKKINYSIEDSFYDLKNQKFILNNLTSDSSHNIFVTREIKKKYNSYISQDKLKNKYDKKQHISYQQLIHKLQESQLKCHYCTKNLYLVYKKKAEPYQWSLERFNNNLGHYFENTCISCLKCNLQRRNSNHEYFKYSKNLNIQKTN